MDAVRDLPNQHFVIYHQHHRCLLSHAYVARLKSQNLRAKPLETYHKSPRYAKFQVLPVASNKKLKLWFEPSLLNLA